MRNITPIKFAVWLNRYFPERQVYIRSRGVVQFYCLTAALQFALFLLLSTFLAWASFASVNVIFKDRIIAAADHRYQQMQVAYENKLAEESGIFDDLNTSLAAAEARAHSTIAAYRQRQIALTGRVASAARNRQDAVIANSTKVGPVSAFITRLIRPWHSSPPAPRPRPPLLYLLDRDTLELKRFDQMANDTINSEQMHLANSISGLRAVIGRTGLQPDQLVQKAFTQEDMGSAEILLSQVQTGIADRNFSLHLLQAGALLNRLSDLFKVLQRIPVVAPVNMAQAHRSSAFGARLDPFTGRYSFHPGLDFSAPLGTTIAATAPGTVTFAGNDGTYGNMVEIDHGFGLRTRYAHLSRIEVANGTHLVTGAVIGQLGTSGRSTGPHLHYEIWYGRSVQDPTHFLDALNKQPLARLAETLSIEPATSLTQKARGRVARGLLNVVPRRHTIAREPHDSERQPS